jgi:hypothetical protein
MMAIRDRKVATMFSVRDISKPNCPTGNAVLAPSVTAHCMQVCVVLKHLGHIALATVAVAALDLCSFTASRSGIWISPMSEKLFYIPSSHPDKIQARD